MCCVVLLGTVTRVGYATPRYRQLVFTDSPTGRPGHHVGAWCPNLQQALRGGGLVGTWVPPATLEAAATPSPPHPAVCRWRGKIKTWVLHHLLTLFTGYGRGVHSFFSHPTHTKPLRTVAVYPSRSCAWCKVGKSLTPTPSPRRPYRVPSARARLPNYCVQRQALATRAVAPLATSVAGCSPSSLARRSTSPS